jgi:aromatic-L-amino-acid decarboxylase
MSKPMPEKTLDPDDWDALRALGHQMLDDMFENLRTIPQEKTWQPMDKTVVKALDERLPQSGQGAEKAYRDFQKFVLPYTNGNRHPRAWGWVRGTGTPLAMLADMLASGANAHLGGGNQAPALVEEQCLRWMAECMGMPPQTTGVLTSGGTMANLLGLVIGRNAKAGFDLRREGLQSGGRPRLMVYGSAETHSWAEKAVELLGLGRESYRRIPVNKEYRVDVGQMRAAVRTDRAAGHRPVAVIGNCGTVNTGAVDDLLALADLCRNEDLWFHVDGAFGALLKLSRRYDHLVRGVEQADSLAFDLHKWMYLPFEIGCVLVRDAEAQRAAFATKASYIEASDGGILAGGLQFADRGIELTRGFKALKLWMSLKAYGMERHGELIEQNVAQSAHLERLVVAHPKLELLAPRPMNVVCFRYVGAGLDEAALNRLNRRLVVELQESGEFIVSGTELGGRYVIRIANTNHRSRMEDFDALVEAVARFGDRLTGEKGPR